MKLKLKLAFVCLFVISLCTAGYCGKIVYPWNATTAIVKAGESFEIWFDSDMGQTVSSVELRSPYINVKTKMDSVRTVGIDYDQTSGNIFDWEINTVVPVGTPADRYDLVLKTSTGKETSIRAVKVVKEYKTDYTIMHFSDTHMCQGQKINGHPERLFKISAIADIANIIGVEMVFVTGDLINNNIFPPKKRAEFFYDGFPPAGLKGMHGFNAATFSVAGNHDFLEGQTPALGSYKEKTQTWNDCHGLHYYNFKYGDNRFMVVNTGWHGFDWNYQLKDHINWLKDAGPGNLRVAAFHKSEKGTMGKWSNEIDLSLAVIGHNHHLAHANPYELGGRKIMYYADSVREHFAINLVRVHTDGSYSVANDKVYVEDPNAEPSSWKPKITLSYAKENNGTSFTNTATVINKFDVAFPDGQVRFVMPKGAYEVSKGDIEQVFENDLVTVVDVRVKLKSNTTTKVAIKLSDSVDLCPNDPEKTSPGFCGCGVSEGSCAKQSLTVTNGSGDGKYAQLQNVVITANPDPPGKEFDKWVIKSGSPAVMNIDKPETLIRLRKGPAELSATYKDLPPVNDAECVSLDMPDLVPGNTVVAKIKMKNTGTTTWTKHRGYRLASVNPADNKIWGLNRVSLSDEDRILPGDEKIFTFSIKVPTTPGIYNCQWKMLQEGVEWFGEKTNNKSTRIGQSGGYFDDCDSKKLWASDGSLKLNKVDNKQGTGCIEYTGASTDEFQKVFTAPYNSGCTLNNAEVQFWYYVSDPSKLKETNQVEIGSSGKADVDEYNWVLKDLSAGWNFIRLNVNTAGKIGKPDLNAINWFRIYRFKSGEVTTRIDGIQVLDPGSNNK